MAKSKSGKTIGEAWSELFIENHELAKSGKALSDDKLKAKMYKEFPEKEEGISTIERVSMQRSCFNKGTAQFKKFGASGTKNRPKSFRYEDGSTPSSGRKKKDAKAEKPSSNKSAKTTKETKSKTKGSKAAASDSTSKRSKRTKKKS